MEHGKLHGYTKFKCRCMPCRVAKSQSNAAHRAKAKVARSPGRPVRALVHGEVRTYNEGKCRCAACRKAKADYRKGWEQPKDSGMPDPVVVERLIHGIPVTSSKQERTEALQVMLSKGITGSVIAQRLGISERTVDRARAA